MAAVPVVLNGVMYPKEKGGQVVPAVFMGFLSVAGLSVGGGPVIPPEILPPDPNTPTHPIVIPPDTPPEPIDPPPTNPPPNAVVVLKPAPETGGWGLAADPGSQKMQWFFTPGATTPGPKHK